MASAGRHGSAGGGGNESASCARANQPALTTPKTRVAHKSCAVLRQKSADPGGPQRRS